MSDEVIYEGKFGNIMRKLCEQTENNTNDLPAAAITGDSEAYAKTLLSNTVSVFMPDRIERKAQFFRTAKEIGEEYLIDLIISEHDNYITAKYSLECDSDFHCLKKIISQADELTFGIDGDKVLLSLIFFTHATYSSGRKISPLDD